MTELDVTLVGVIQLIRLQETKPSCRFKLSRPRDKHVYRMKYLMFAGLRFGPKDPDGNADGSLISFSPGNPESYRKWTNVMEDFVAGIVVSDYTHTLTLKSVITCIYRPKRSDSEFIIYV